MKITKRQLKRIILEEIENLEYEIEKKKTDMMLVKDHPQDVEAQEDSWAGGANIHHNIDHAEVMYGDSTTKGIEKLRIYERSKAAKLAKQRFLSESFITPEEEMKDFILDLFVTNLDDPGTMFIDDIIEEFTKKYSDVNMLHDLLDQLEAEGVIRLEGSSGFYHIVDSGMPDYIGGMLGEEKNRFISEMKASYGTTPMLAFSGEPSRPFTEMRAEALDIMDRLLDGGAFLMNPRDYEELNDLIQDLAADGDEDFESFRRLLVANNQGQYIRISFR